MKFIIGQKKQMTQLFMAKGAVVPVTVVKAEPNVVVQIKTADKDGYFAVQVGSAQTKKSHNKAGLGHLRGLQTSRWLKEFRFKNPKVNPRQDDSLVELMKGLSEKFQRGQKFGVEIFRTGDSVRVTASSKGKGFQGVVKRHGFSGSPKTHGNKDQLRMPGSLGAKGPAHVFKGARMGGRMGSDKVTVAGLHVAKVDVANNLLYISGALPGAYNSPVFIQGSGSFRTGKKSKPESVQNDKPATEPASEANTTTAS